MTDLALSLVHWGSQVDWCTWTLLYKVPLVVAFSLLCTDSTSPWLLHKMPRAQNKRESSLGRSHILARQGWPKN